MRKIFILSLLAIGFISCKNNTEKKQGTTEKNEVVTDAVKGSSLLGLGCYSYKDNNNTVFLEITDLENGVKGKLTYQFDGKDKNSGSFSGELVDNKLFATYTFLSEGVQSKREIAFLIKGNQLVEGYGELNENGTAFTDKNNIEYTSTMPLSKTDCNE